MRSKYQPSPTAYAAAPTVFRRTESSGSLGQFLDPLLEIARRSERLRVDEIGEFYHGTQRYTLPRVSLRGPAGGGDLVRLGIFAAIHGDEPEGAWALREFLVAVASDPTLARGYEVIAFPVCNPSGFEDHTRASRAGKDLNREFWRASTQPEVYYLERELGVLDFDGIVALHSDDTSSGVYAFVRGPVLTEVLAQPALAAASAFLPLATDPIIDGFPASHGLIRQSCYEGVLSNPAELKRAPFEIIFETPQRKPRALQIGATVAALQSILANYRELISYGQNL